MEQSITIPAKVGNRKGVLPVVVSGRVFSCITSTAEFFVQPDDGQRRSARKGSTWGNPGATRFNRLLFLNDTAADIDVTFFAGDQENHPNTPLDGDTTVPAELVMTAAIPTQFLKAIAAAAPPTALAAAQTFFRKATVLAKKSLSGTLNVGNVRIGASAAAGEQPYELAPGDEVVLQPAVGQKWNFQNWYLDVDTDDDGVVVIYS